MEANDNSGKKFMAQINVTPLVDVMLVLLIIFMVTAPMMQSGIDVKLPKVEAAGVTAENEPIVVTVTKERLIYLNDKLKTRTELQNDLKIFAATKSDRLVLLRADESVPYGIVMSAMGIIRSAGVEKVGMITEPTGSTVK